MRKTVVPAGGRRPVTVELSFDYELRPVLKPRELIVLLHGFEETGHRLLSKLAPVLPPEATVLAPNGPFPIPRLTDKGYRLGHAWYIYNPASREYVIDMALAVRFLAEGIEALGLAKLPKRVIGFSQGGYLAPIAAAKLSGVKQVVGMACEYLVDEFPAGAAFRLDGVHGGRDEVVSADEARASHKRIAERGLEGRLVVIDESGHKIDDAMRAALSELIT